MIIKKYRLRWRFDFANKPTRIGQWNGTNENVCHINTEGLVRASIEAEDQVTWEVKTLCECAGDDFVQFQGLATFTFDNQLQGYHELVGLKLKKRYTEVYCYLDGSMAEVKRPEEDLKFHYEGFGK